MRNKKLFLSLHTTEYGFTGLTDRYIEVKKLMPDVLLERPTIENIMLGHIEGGNI